MRLRNLENPFSQLINRQEINNLMRLKSRGRRGEKPDEPSRWLALLHELIAQRSLRCGEGPFLSSEGASLAVLRPLSG
jgi:hypothetical protein